MNRQSLVAGLIAVLVVGGVLGYILYSTRNNRLELAGSVLQVRSHSVEAEATLAVVDFRVANTSAQQFVVRELDVYLEQKDGKTIEGEVFAEVDAQRVFSYYPVLGKKHNSTLLIREKIESGQSLDRMIGARFNVADSVVQERKAIRIVIEDVDGQRREFTERR